MWTMAALEARRDPLARAPRAGPCRPEEVVKCLDELYRRRRIELLHARILRAWGRRGRAPDPARARERCDWRLWTEAIGRLEFPLRRAGIVGGGVFGAGCGVLVGGALVEPGDDVLVGGGGRE